MKWEDLSNRREHAPELPHAHRDPRGYWIEPIAAMLHADADAAHWNLSTRARGHFAPPSPEPSGHGSASTPWAV
eukprot:909399-Pyramimonas_sp.AAC.1